jgi:hypothetical protein
MTSLDAYEAKLAADNANANAVAAAAADGSGKKMKAGSKKRR